MAHKRKHHSRGASAGPTTLHRVDIPAEVRRARTYCRPCDLWGYPSRQAAKRHAKNQHPGEDLTPFPCPSETGLWHFGHRQQQGVDPAEIQIGPVDLGTPEAI